MCHISTSLAESHHLVRSQEIVPYLITTSKTCRTVEAGIKRS